MEIVNIDNCQHGKVSTWEIVNINNCQHGQLLSWQLSTWTRVHMKMCTYNLTRILLGFFFFNQITNLKVISN